MNILEKSYLLPEHQQKELAVLNDYVYQRYPKVYCKNTTSNLVNWPTYYYHGHYVAFGFMKDSLILQFSNKDVSSLFPLKDSSYQTNVCCVSFNNSVNLPIKEIEQAIDLTFSDFDDII